MRIILAPDSFKGSLTAQQACAALAEGARAVFPEVELIWLPLADGGEGTLATLLRICGGQEFALSVSGPSGKPHQVRWGILSDGRAVIETAQASGLELVPATERDPLGASTFGTGQLMIAALDTGCKELLVGLGGSATTDGGCGALEALGFSFKDSAGRNLGRGGGSLAHLATIDASNCDSRLDQVKITLLSDVTTPLCGIHGSARLFGPQKGCTAKDVEVLEAGLHRLAQVAQGVTGHNLAEAPGAGAAGGLGFGLMTFCGAQVLSGIEAILEAAKFTDHLETADLVLTGEGSLDAQTLKGKTIAGVTALARAARHGRGVPVVAFGGAVSLSGTELDDLGLLSAVALPDRPMDMAYCLDQAGPLLARATERALRLLVWPGGLSGFTS